MKRETIMAVGRKNNVKDLEVFVEFFSKRFPDESDNILSYVSEWAERFNTGSPERYMDSQSLRIYEEVRTIKIKS
jgi:hypothetical protein